MSEVLAQLEKLGGGGNIQIVRDVKGGNNSSNTYAASVSLVAEHTHLIAIGVTRCSFKGSTCTCSKGTMNQIYSSPEAYGYYRTYWSEFSVSVGETVTLSLESIPYSSSATAMGNTVILICY